MRLIVACLIMLIVAFAPALGAPTGDPIDGNENPTTSELDCEGLVTGAVSGPYADWQCDVYLMYEYGGWWDWPWN